MSFRPIFKYRDWLPEINKLDDEILSLNVAAIYELEKNHMLDLWSVSSNPGAITLLERNIPNINIKYLSCNPAAAHLFKNFEKINIGVNNGPGTTLAWSLKYFIWSFSNEKISNYLSILPFLFLRLFDKLINEKSSWDGASGFYFIGRKNIRYKFNKEELHQSYKGNQI